VKLCAYCGKSASTRDHIPPKSLFPKPRPKNLITVPSCFDFNSQFQKDDDYFWLNLSIRQENAKNDAACEAASRAIKNLSRPKAAGFQRSFLASLSNVAVHSPGGLYLGDRLAYQIEFARLNRIATRITKGMFCRLRNVPLAKGYVASARAVEGFSESAFSDLKAMLGHVSGESVHKVSSVFSYRSRFLEEDPNFSLWLFTIYDTTSFVGLTLLESDSQWDESF